MSCLRLHSRSGVPTAPRKYFVVTMLAALTLHDSGNSTPRCSKLIEPSRQFVITTSRRSQLTSSYGWTPSVVHTRSIFSPAPALFRERLVVTPSPPSSARSATARPNLSKNCEDSAGTAGGLNRIGPALLPGARSGPQRLDLALEVGQRVEGA